MTSRFRTLLAIVLGAVLFAGWFWRSAIRSALHLPTVDDVRRQLVWRSAVPAHEIRSGRVLVLLVTGQSNAGNYGEKFSPRPRPTICEAFGSRLFEARDPFLGSDSAGSTPWVALGNKLLDSHRCDSVVFALAVRGGIGIREWLPERSMNQMVFGRIAELRSLGFSPDLVLWQQGESDARYSNQAAKLAYGSSLREFIASLRRYGVRAPVLVARATRTVANSPDPLIRAQQEAVIDPAQSIFAGPDIDALGPEFRRDGTHFNREGEMRLAQMWYTAIRAVDAARFHAPKS